MEPAPLYDMGGRTLAGAAVFLPAYDGALLRFALCPPPGDIKGTVLLSPGRGEPLEKYTEVIGELQARGLIVLVHDWRGHGLSQRFDIADPQLGHARGWRLFLSDLQTGVAAFEGRLPRPWIGLGHSMGGGLTLLAMGEGTLNLDAAVLSTPMLGLRLGGRPPALVRAAANAMTLLGQGGRLAPRAEHTPHDNDASGEALTHDLDRWQALQSLLDEHPTLRIGDPTWAWVAFALSLCRRLEALPLLERIEAPVVLVGAEHDRLVTTAAQRRAAERLPHGRYVEVAGAFHEVLMETDARREVFWRAFDTALAAVQGA